MHFPPEHWLDLEQATGDLPLIALGLKAVPRSLAHLDPSIFPCLSGFGPDSFCFVVGEVTDDVVGNAPIDCRSNDRRLNWRRSSSTGFCDLQSDPEE